MYPKDTQIPIKRSLKFFEENNGKLLPLRTDESKEWVIFTWIGRKPKGEKKFFKSSYTVVKNIGFYSLYVDALSRDIKQGLSPCSRDICTGLKSGCYGNIKREYKAHYCSNKCSQLDRVGVKTKVEDEVRRIYREYGIQGLTASQVDLISSENPYSYYNNYKKAETEHPKTWFDFLKSIVPELTEKEWLEVSGTKGSSMFERFCKTLLKHYYGEKTFLHKTRPNFLKGLELDLYDPVRGVAIEIDGEQHRRQTGIGNFNNILKRDARKDELCSANEIFLLRIPCSYSLDTVEDLFKELCKFDSFYSNEILSKKLLTSKTIYELLPTEICKHQVFINIPGKRELENLYRTEQLSIISIARNYEVSPARVRKWLELYSIPIFTNSERNKGKNRLQLPEQEVVKAYTKYQLSLGELARFYGCSINPIKRVLKGYGIQTRVETITNQMKKIRNLDTGLEYPSIAEASKETGILRTNIGNVLIGRSKTAGGYKWEYVD
jgi:hypothetical protein